MFLVPSAMAGGIVESRPEYASVTGGGLRCAKGLTVAKPANALVCKTVMHRFESNPWVQVQIPASKRRFRYTGNMPQTGTFDRIAVEPAKCGGKPCIRGMRITVRRVLELLAAYPHREDILKEYPFLEEEDLQQALRYAAATVEDEVSGINRVA